MRAYPALGLAAVAALIGMGASCAQPPAPAAPASASQSSILVSSTPAAGSTVEAPVNELVLNFEPPARLMEVTVTGPDGTMPTMITPIGEVARYSVPLPGLGPGSYRVDWRASAAGSAHQGSFGFRVQ